MRPLIIIIFLCLFNITFNSAQENNIYSKSGWIAESDNSTNRIISEIIDKSDLTGKINIIKILGLRKDRDFNKILEDIYYNKNSTEKEVLLYYCVNNMINSENDYKVNSIILSEIFLHIDKYSESLLRKEIIRKTDFAERKTAVKTLACEGRILADISRKEGKLNALMSEECRVFFIHSKTYDEPVLEQIKDIIYRNAVNLDKIMNK